MIVQFLCVRMQAQQSSVPLRMVLDSLEVYHQITFSYADENIDGLTVDPIAKSSSLSEALEVLSMSTGLEFRILDGNIVAIIKAAADRIDFCGYLFSKDTRLPISGASIQSGRRGTLSDGNGYFGLEKVQLSDSVTIRYLGYKPLKGSFQQLIDATGCAEILMEENIIKLQEVIINNYVINGINVSSDGALRIDTKTMGILPGLTDPDVLQTIQAMPGIQSINETVSDINIRGGTNDQNLIFWDGIKMYQTGHFFGMISGFNPYLTDKVVLIKNGTPTEMSDGVSGTIDIQTDDRVNQELSGAVGINMINADLFLKIPLAEKIALHLSGRNSISNLIETPTYTQYFNRVFGNTDVTDDVDAVTDSIGDSNQQFNFNDITAKLLFDITERDKLRIGFLSINNKISYEESDYIDNVTESKTSGLEQHSMAGSISYRKLWNERLQTGARFYLSKYLLSSINFDVSNEQRLIQENEVLESGLKLDARIALTDQIDLFSGYQFFETGISNLEDINNPTFRRLIKRVVRNHALFTEGNYSSVSGSTNLRLGVRLNYYEKLNTFLPEPRLAFSQKFLDHFWFEVLGEMKNQSTSQVIDLQNDFLGVEKRRWVLANEEDIPIVRSKQLSAGIRYQSGTFLVSLDGYRKFVQGITSSSQGFQNQFQYVRAAGSYQVTGLDFLINKAIGNLSTWLSYTYAENNYNFPTFEPTDFPNNLDIRNTVTLGASYRLGNLQASGGVNWRTGKPYTPGLETIDGKIVYDQPNQSRLPNYFRADLSMTYRIKFSPGISGEIGASVWNISDFKNVINTYYQAEGQTGLNEVQQYALGLTPNLMFRINF